MVCTFLIKGWNRIASNFESFDFVVRVMVVSTVFRVFVMKFDVHIPNDLKLLRDVGAFVN